MAAWSYNDAQKWGNFDPYAYKAGGSWDDLVNYAKRDWQTQYERSTGSFDPFTGGMTRIGDISSQIYLDGNSDDPWSNAVFNTKTGNTPDGYISRLYRKNDGTIGETFYQEQKGMAGVPWGAFAVIAAPFAASALGAGAAGAGAAEGAAAASGAGAAGAGAAGAGSAATSAGYLAAADAAGGLIPAWGSSSAYAAGLGGAGTAAAGGGNALSGLLSSAGEKAASMGITDWINIAGTGLNYLGSQKAADALKDGSEAAIAYQERRDAQTRADYLPYMLSGYDALSKINAGLAPGGEFSKNFTEQDFWADPVTKLGFQFGLDEGTKGVNRLASASGSLDSGKTLKDLTRFATDYTGTKANDSFNRFNVNRDAKFNKLASLSGVGQTATNAVTTAGTNTTNQISQGLQDVGGARASSYIGGMNALNDGIGTWMNNSQQNKMLEAQQEQNRLLASLLGRY